MDHLVLTVMSMKVYVDHTFRDPKVIPMVTTSGGNREAGTRVEIRNMIAKNSLIHWTVGRKLTANDVVTGEVSSTLDGPRYVVVFNIQRISPTRISAINDPDFDMASTGLPMPQLGEPVDWLWWTLKIEQPAESAAEPVVISEAKPRKIIYDPNNIFN